MTKPSPVEVPGEVEIDISIEAPAWGDPAPLQRLFERALREAFAEADLSVVPGTELSVVLTDDAAIRELNREWRGKDKPTNVLSFPGGDEDEPPFGPLLGDIVIARETLEHEAEAEKKSFPAHLTHLFIHGLLHLFGYDHQIEEEAQEMEDAERRILARLGISDPYAETPLAGDEA
ncbi:rRNA maturation RNase YbeY [Rhizobiales bacterium]|uniref:rRNA maturation RNase YbeY n=1 Tax=Hongsoonwoonella zoysiae TaxID=2821844 RepID=UPI001561ADC0|nr:rRNA maturation RNase YbeY [Hongsoonwoonella zoysiae]NRG16531.1 rRNA maturation RNase YbeY [Hongsoonwoonella zoysiae]